MNNIYFALSALFLLPAVAAKAADDADAKPEPASAPSTPPANPLMQGMFGN
jgi:hypothetical protein